MRLEKPIWTCTLSCALSWVCLTAAAVAQLPESQKTFSNDLYVGYRNCQKCHVAQTDVLESHAHFTTFRELHRTDKAKQIARDVGVKSIKRSARCVRCHYSPEPASNGEKAASGISCESCHGPARDWILKHNDYGGPTASKQSESPLHRQRRIADSIHSGMRHPSNVYLLARSCLTCHIVDDEEIVNAGHSAYSRSFDLVSWSQGKMRHNFYRTGGKHNAASDTKRLRMMYVVGVMAKLEFSLRATAKANGKEYAVAQARQCIRAQRELEKLGEASRHRSIQLVLDAMKGAKFRSENLATLPKIADRISEIAFSFAAKNDGSNLAAIDPFLPPTAEYR